ncbi:MAG: right-handed parallel beta-helix repeat-containing protein [Bryobacteraceae bacterium]
MLTRRVIYFWLALFIAGTVCAMADDGWVGSGKILVVGQPSTPCPGATYTTIGAAVTAANPGDEIDICPALYPEQLIITKRLKLVGVEANGVNRVLLQPSLTDLMGLATEAVITVMNTQGVGIENLAIDASHNTVATCSPGLAGVHFFNASGKVKDSAIFGAELTNPTGCPTLPVLNGFGVLVDANQPGPFSVSVEHNSIHDYTANGVFVNGTAGGVKAEIVGNTISGVGPASGTKQFAIYLLNGAIGKIHDNALTEGLCGSLTTVACIAVRSEGVTTRNAGDGTEVNDNIITDAQSGIFINGANDLKVMNNQISNIYGLDGIDIQGTAAGHFTNSVIKGNRMFNMGAADEGCGVWESNGTGTFTGNEISDNTVNDAYCGVGYVPSDMVGSGTYSNVLYTLVNTALPNPPDVEP